MNTFIQRHRQRRPIWRAAMLALCAGFAAAPALAIERGTTPAGVRYVSGGIGLAERNQLHGERTQYRLWVATVAKGSGAYLSNARVRISPLAGGADVLEQTMDGPWLFVDLPAGQYTVTATWKGDGASAALTQQVRVNVDKTGLRQVVLRFPAKVDVSPERAQPFGGNPFGASAPH